MFRFVVVAAISLALVAAGPLPPHRLRMQDMPDGSSTPVVLEPHGNMVESDPVTFAWTNRHTNRGISQTSCRVVVGSTSDVLTSTVWDSGVIAQATPSLEYAGDAFKQTSTYFWAVQWTDSNGEVSPFSDPSSFHVGPSPAVWNASSWIGPNYGMLRTEFTYTTSTGSVMAYVAGIGYFQLYVNGIRVDTDALSGAWTTWNARVLYYSFDLSPHLKPGKNAIGVMLGKGWRDISSFPPQWMPGPCDVNERMLRLVMVDTVNSNVIVASDASWSGTNNGPVVYDSVYNGETYDARKEQAGWANAGFNGGGWTPVNVMQTSCFNPILTPISFPGIAIDSVRAPVSVTRLSSASQVVNFGDNLSGWTLISVKGPAGSNITLKHAEVLQHPPYGPANGEIYQGNLRSAKATDVYILKGDPNGEVFQPHFTYHGFQFVEVLYYPGDLNPSNVRQVHFRTMNPVRVNFTSTSDVLNRIQFAAVMGQGSNQMSVPTDCDQRDERLGWMGDAGLSADTLATNYDIAGFMNNYLQLMVDNQDSKGSLPDTVPFARYGGRPADPSWSAAFPQTLYVRYAVAGTLSPAKKFWDQLMNYFNDLSAQVSAAGGFVHWPSPYGDWVPADPNTKVANQLCAAYNYILDVREAATLAKAMGDKENNLVLTKLANKLASQYTVDFFDKSTDCFGTCGQTSYGFSYLLGLIPKNNITDFTTRLVQDITVRYGGHVSVGIIGAKALFPTLSSLGANSTALTLAEQTSYPSWGYMLYNTVEPANSSVWELWDAPTQGPGMNSRNHHMFSSISYWLVNYVGGFNGVSDRAVCSGENLHLTPAMFTGVSSADTSMNTRCGTVALQYTRHGGVQCAKLPETRSSTRQSAVNFNKNLTVTCGDLGGVITSVDFASWGRPSGDCGSFAVSPTCHSPVTMDVVSEACVGKSTCSLPSHADYWESVGPAVKCEDGYDDSNPRVLTVQVTCSVPHAMTVSAVIPVGSTATVSLPLNGLDRNSVMLKESNRILLTSGMMPRMYVEGIRGVVATEGQDHIDVNIGSGSYSFALTPSSQ